MALQFPSSSNSPLSLPNFAALNTIKLTNSNFPIWKKQISNYLKANSLFSFVDGSNPKPSDESSKAYLEWSPKDNLVSAILTFSLTEPIMAQVIECNTSIEIWTRLHTLFAASSNAQLVSACLQLATLKKGSDSVSEYFHKVKSIINTIRAAGRVVEDDDFVIQIFSGLGTDYDPVIDSLSTQSSMSSSDQVLIHLMNHEARLSRNSSSILGTPPLSVNSTTTAPPEANFTATRGGRGSSRRGSPSRGGSNTGRGFSDPGRGDPSGGHCTSGRGGRGSYFSGEPDTRPVCQICDKRGHSALRCWSRFDQVLEAPPPRSFHMNSTTSNWYPDTAANHHFTPDIGNLRLDSLPYSGTEQISLGDGSTVPIRNHDAGPSSFGPR